MSASVTGGDNSPVLNTYTELVTTTKKTTSSIFCRMLSALREIFSSPAKLSSNAASNASLCSTKSSHSDFVDDLTQNANDISASLDEDVLYQGGKQKQISLVDNFAAEVFSACEERYNICVADANKFAETDSLYSSLTDEESDYESIERYSDRNTDVSVKTDAICFGENSSVNSTSVAGSEPIYAKAVSKKEHLINALEDLSYSLDRLPKNADAAQSAIKDSLSLFVKMKHELFQA